MYASSGKGNVIYINLIKIIRIWVNIKSKAKID